MIRGGCGVVDVCGFYCVFCVCFYLNFFREVGSLFLLIEYSSGCGVFFLGLGIFRNFRSFFDVDGIGFMYGLGLYVFLVFIFKGSFFYWFFVGNVVFFCLRW